MISFVDQIYALLLHQANLTLADLPPWEPWKIERSVLHWLEEAGLVLPSAVCS